MIGLIARKCKEDRELKSGTVEWQWNYGNGTSREERKKSSEKNVILPQLLAADKVVCHRQPISRTFQT